MKLPYCEGTWFWVPLLLDTYAVGVVARSGRWGKVIFCYFFGPYGQCGPNIEMVSKLCPDNSILVARISDLFLIEEKWPILGNSSSWDRSKWKMPPFVQREILTNRAWRVWYSDRNPLDVVRIEPEPFNSTLAKDSVWGAASVENYLRKCGDSHLKPAIEKA